MDEKTPPVAPAHNASFVDAPLIDVLSFTDLGNLHAKVVFSTGEVLLVDLGGMLTGSVFAPVHATGSLAGTQVENGTLAFLGGGDLDPGMIYLAGVREE